MYSSTLLPPPSPCLPSPFPSPPSPTGQGYPLPLLPFPLERTRVPPPPRTGYAVGDVLLQEDFLGWYNLVLSTSTFILSGSTNSKQCCQKHSIKTYVECWVREQQSCFENNIIFVTEFAEFSWVILEKLEMHASYGKDNQHPLSFGHLRKELNWLSWQNRPRFGENSRQRKNNLCSVHH